MNIYPSLQFSMGLWKYYVVKMSARELSEQVKFASEIYEDKTLDEAIQRVLNDSRVKRDIVTYLQRQPWRFFSSIVVAALEGNPKFYPVSIADDPRFEVLADSQRLQESFGVLAFDGTQDYYALDGQHRLASIRAALDPNEPVSDDTPADFKDDEFSVVIVVPERDDDAETFKEKYRRLFSNLNRYAKPMSQADNIIMDEDDPFAIVTRRLISEHEFFRVEGRQRESVRVKTTPGKNLKSGQPFFTSLEMLYDLNSTLLNARWRQNEGWFDGTTSVDFKTFTRFRPDEAVISDMFAELTMYWDALLDEIEALREDPSMMRNHGVLDDGADDPDSGHPGSYDHLLFWPIGQQLLMDMARQLLDRRVPNAKEPSRKDVADALDGLGELEWRLSEPPWKHLLLIYEERPDGRGSWKMRSEQRKECVRVGGRLQQWLVGYDELDEHEVESLHGEWAQLLIGADEDAIRTMWKDVTLQRLG